MATNDVRVVAVPVELMTFSLRGRLTASSTLSTGALACTQGPRMVPTMVSQRDLDYLLSKASPDEQARFALLLDELDKRAADRLKSLPLSRASWQTWHFL